MSMVGKDGSESKGINKKAYQKLLIFLVNGGLGIMGSCLGSINSAF